MKKTKVFIILLFILLIATFWRFYQLNQVPPSPSLDEVSIGWNAYSILETGRDEYGNQLPILLRAYDDWRPALYVYLVIPLVKFLGLTAVAVRLPSVLLSLLAVLTTYFLTQELLRNSRWAIHYSLLAAFFLAISPWHIYISRLGHEVNAGLTFSLLAVFFFLKAIDRKKLIFLFSSAIFFGLSFYTYQSQKIFGPLMVLALAIIFRKQLGKFKKEIVLAGLIGLFLIVPIMMISLSPEAMIRFQGTSAFTNQPEVLQRASVRTARDYQQNDILGLLFDNRRVAMGLTVLRAYFSHFDPNWFFFNDGAEKHKVPGLGLFYLWELPLLLIGGYQLISGKFSREIKLLLLSWLLIAPLPASITTEAPHAMRAFSLLPIPQILSALGTMVVFSKIKSIKKRYLSLLVIGLSIVLLLLSLGYLYHNYFVNFPREQSASFQYPLGQAITYVLKNEDRYQKVVFSNQDHCYQSYMFFLFFSRYNPSTYLNQGGTVSGGFAESHAFGKYESRPIDWEKEERGSILYVGNSDDFPEGAVYLKTFKLLDDREVIKIVE